MKALPPTGGSSTASLFALGAGALLVGGGLVVRRFIR
jgi:LPXTG-motif cell wall-anchored protein